jgi:hypothetical protein
MASHPTQVNANLAALAEGRNEPVAGPDPPRPGLTSGELARLRRRMLAARRHLEPVDLREGDPRLDRLRRGRSSSPASSSTRSRSTSASRCRRAGRGRRPAPGLPRGGDGFVSFEVAPELAHDTDGHARHGARLLAATRPPERDDQDPRARREGVPAIEQAIYEGINVNVTLLFAVERTSASPRPTSAGSSGATPRASRSTSTRSRASSSRASTREVDKRSPRSARASSPARRRSPTRAPPTALQGDLLRRALGGAARRRRRGPAPAVGLDRVKNPAYPDTLYVDELVAPTRSTRCRWKTLLAVAEHGQITGHRRGATPSPGARRARQGGDRHERGDRDAARRGHRRSSRTR